MVDTKTKIIAAAVKCFRSHESETLEKVAEEAGVSRRTLHRYFENRQDLLESCKNEMLTRCNKAMHEAYESDKDPINKVRNMLFAAIEQGANYAFIKRIYERINFSEVDRQKEFEFDNVKSNWLKIIKGLQEEKRMNDELTIPWIFNLFGSIIETSILAVEAGDVARNDSKKFAWISFKGAIGLKE
ncbi:DNA-binding transcriptional regulator, AcrR family [Catalinimonas alkaloidigena]|uniref:DNA-binding transcriptional regulator, AcrR family n=1 Tax=Catalinimonas alkaloidigena TaxID=1075417 RepID=A0A1G9TZM5_9BACT|nr:TetR/AcrR family transcriptional regulator [Catalinimonas alkaloidigena]SDM52725.1 DNA-binding transcriptional regulator, AcrR family [Catalinimonas alkaloidigena]